MYLVYGINLNALTVIAANAITLILSLVILSFKFNYRKTSL